METFKLDQEFHAFCVRATSFPDGIMQAHSTLHALVPFSTERIYFGISRPEGGDDQIIYRAGMTELEPGELKKHDLEEFVIKKGNYTSVVLKDYMKDLSSISKAFDEMLKNPNLDPEGACIEWYLSKEEVRCMVRLKDK